MSKLKLNQLLSVAAWIYLGTLINMTNAQTLQEKMGYAKSDKLLIIHADDLGVAHSVNLATLSAYNDGAITSSSMMVPTPWFTEWVNMVKDHGNLDVGIHITLTAEWKYYRWDGVLSSDDIPGLINDEGYLYPAVSDVVENSTAEEVQREATAQIDWAIDYGLELSHFDTHMGSMRGSPELFEVYLNLGRKYNVPVMVSNDITEMEEYAKFINPSKDILVTSIQELNGKPSDDELDPEYIQLLDNLKPGVNVLIVHLGYDDNELQGVMVDHPDWGATWRQNDYNNITSVVFKNALLDRNIQLVTWGDVKRVMTE